MAIDGARIQRITKEGLFYLDDEGQEKFISFAVCHLNYVMEGVEAYQQDSRDERQEEIRRRRGYKCVADTGCGGYPFDSDLCCAEFYTNPRTLFEFATYDPFDGLLGELRNYGWTWRDRS